MGQSPKSLESKINKSKVPNVWDVEIEEIKDSNTDPRSPNFDNLLKTEIIWLEEYSEFHYLSAIQMLKKRILFSF